MKPIPRWALASATAAPVLLIGGWTVSDALQPPGLRPRPRHHQRPGRRGGHRPVGDDLGARRFGCLPRRDLAGPATSPVPGPGRLRPRGCRHRPGGSVPDPRTGTPWPTPSPPPWPSCPSACGPHWRRRPGAPHLCSFTLVLRCWPPRACCSDWWRGSRPSSTGDNVDSPHAAAGRRSGPGRWRSSSPPAGLGPEPRRPGPCRIDDRRQAGTFVETDSLASASNFSSSASSSWASCRTISPISGWASGSQPSSSSVNPARRAAWSRSMASRRPVVSANSQPSPGSPLHLDQAGLSPGRPDPPRCGRGRPSAATRLLCNVQSGRSAKR